MSDTFYFSTKFCKSNKNAVFHSDRGDDYYVNYLTTKSGEIMLSVEWIMQRQNLIKVELFTEDLKLISSQLRTGDKNKVCLKFCITTNQDVFPECNLMFVITIIPHVVLGSCPTSPEDELEQLNLHDDKIKDLSEDLLVGLAMDMRDLFIHGDLSDAIITNGSHVVKVHSAILLARSPVFREILQGSSHEKIITIPNVSVEALEDMIVFIYSSFIKLKDMDRAEELYVLANEYKIEDLQEVCSLYMSNCTVDCALKILILADKYKDFHLKKSIIEFIVKNLCEIKSSEKWEKFTKESIGLVSEIFSSVSGATEKNTLRAFMSRLSSKC